MTAIIAVANHKGGSGKTTTTYHLGKSLAANDGYNTHGLLVPLHELERIAAAVY